MPPHPHKVEVKKSDTESGHFASLYSQPRYSHVPVSMFLLSMLVLASDCLHSTEGLDKLKHQAKVCLCACMSFFFPIQWAKFCPKCSVERSSHQGLAWTTLCLGAQGAASRETRRDSGCSHIGFASGCDEEVYVEKSISTQVRKIHGTSLSSVAYAYRALINIFKKQPVSMENSSLVSGGPIAIVFMELGI